MVNHNLVKSLGINPVDLPETIINVRGISGKGFERNSKLIYLEIKYNGQLSLERVLVQEDCGNILSYNTLQLLGVTRERKEIEESTDSMLKIMSATAPEKKK